MSSTSVHGRLRVRRVLFLDLAGCLPLSPSSVLAVAPPLLVATNNSGHRSRRRSSCSLADACSSALLGTLPPVHLRHSAAVTLNLLA